MKIAKIIYWISTTLMCLIFMFSATMYFTKYEAITVAFTNLGFPTWLVYPLAVAKVLGVVAVLSNRSKLLKEWAYAGFFFDAVMAAAAHYHVGDGELGPSVLAMILTIVSRLFDDYTGKIIRLN
ncbi:MAG: DoxX family protein [Bacteroidota bacterium]